MTDTLLLDAALLGEFESRLRAAGVPAIDAAEPGLSIDEIQQTVAHLGLELPSEAKTWWAWRNGVPVDKGAAATEVGPGRKWLTLSDAAAECAKSRQEVLDENNRPLPGLEGAWSFSWFPFARFEAFYIIETDVPAGAPSPVRVVWTDDQPGREPDLPSMRALVTLWIEAIDAGIWAYDTQRDRWVEDFARLKTWPPGQRGLV